MMGPTIPMLVSGCLVHKHFEYHSILVASAQIILFLEMLKFWKIIFFQRKEFSKENEELLE
jgi:hypothetical protein